jgi:ribA/ribD-fused uncharacterized protein
MNKQELLKRLAGGETFEFEGFQKGVLSPGHSAEFKSDGYTFQNVEQYYQYRKAKYFEDDIALEKLIKISDPIRVREIGKTVRGFDPQLWAAMMDLVLFAGNNLKFRQNPNMKRILLETNDNVLVYMNPADTIWGAGLDMLDSRIKEPFEWPGENIFGFTLMEVRDEIRENKDI